MKLLSIASGSSGNCIYVGTETTHILIDAGISGKRIEEGLKTIIDRLKEVNLDIDEDTMAEIEADVLRDIDQKRAVNEAAEEDERPMFQ